MTQYQGVSRRMALQATGLGALGLLYPGKAAAQTAHATIAATALAQQPQSDGPALEPLNRLPRMVQVGARVKPGSLVYHVLNRPGRTV